MDSRSVNTPLYYFISAMYFKFSFSFYYFSYSLSFLFYFSPLNFFSLFNLFSIASQIFEYNELHIKSLRIKIDFNTLTKEKSSQKLLLSVSQQLLVASTNIPTLRDLPKITFSYFKRICLLRGQGSSSKSAMNGRPRTKIIYRRNFLTKYFIFRLL